MRRIGWRIFVLFAIAFLITLVVVAPASLLATVVEKGSKGRFVLANASGTVWQGNAIPAIRQRTGGLLALEKLHWNIAVLPLFAGKISSQFHWDNVEQDQPMMAVMSLSQLELRNAVFPFHADILGELSPLLQPVQMSGEMQIKSERFVFSRQGMNGTALVDWTNAGSVLSSVKPLGHYRINLAGNGDRLDIALITITGMLLLEGNGSLITGRGLSFQGTARASIDSNGSLDELLSNLGPESEPGVHRLNLIP
jgi:general secretion pathway protein N